LLPLPLISSLATMKVVVDEGIQLDNGIGNGPVNGMDLKVAKGKVKDGVGK
jgi:hypothetical protein